tara:strand:+ start:1337 stop:1846 length:510 start_codon:yes stop_codon:yes gene_type:complete
MTKPAVLERISAIIKMVKAIGPVYSTMTPIEKKHTQTTIGASLWYGLGGVRQYTGYCSKQLLLEQKNANKWISKYISHEHPWPRKLMATKLLSKYESPEKELKLIIEKAIVVNFVTKAENKKLIQFQKEGIFETPEKSYHQAGIELTPFPYDAIMKIKKNFNLLDQYIK